MTARVSPARVTQAKALIWGAVAAHLTARAADEPRDLRALALTTAAEALHWMAGGDRETAAVCKRLAKSYLRAARRERECVA